MYRRRAGDVRMESEKVARRVDRKDGAERMEGMKELLREVGDWTLGSWLGLVQDKEDWVRVWVNEEERRESREEGWRLTFALMENLSSNVLCICGRSLGSIVHT